jgi:hypothetical protein
MKRILVFASLVLALTFAAIAPAQAAGAKQKFTEKQLLSLIANARTAADHTQISEYYEAKSIDFLAESKEHQAMADAYKKNATTNNAKFVKGTVDHCYYIAESLKADAAKMHELATMHEAMAKEAR